MEIVAEYFFVNSKYENMKSERVEGLTYWEKQQRRLEEYFSLSDVSSSMNYRDSWTKRKLLSGQ